MAGLRGERETKAHKALAHTWPKLEISKGPRGPDPSDPTEEPDPAAGCTRHSLNLVANSVCAREQLIHG